MSGRIAARYPLSGRALAILTAFGVLGAVGSYYVPGLLERAADTVGRKPLKVTVALPEEHGWPFAPRWLLPLSTGSLPSDAPLPGDDVGTTFQEFRTWQAAHGVVGQSQAVRLTISGVDDRPVIIQSIKPVVDDRSEPLKGWYIREQPCENLRDTPCQGSPGRT